METKKISSLPVLEAMEEHVHVVADVDGVTKLVPAEMLAPKVELPEDHVKFSAQEQTDEQKAQARENIGAVTAEDVPGGADWNASDGEDGYVKNRTHYEVSPSIDFTFENSMLPDEVAFTIGDGEEAQVFHLVWPGNYPSNLFETMTCYWYDGDTEKEGVTYSLDSFGFPYIWFRSDYERVRLILMDGKTAYGGSVHEAGIYAGRYANGTIPKFRIVNAGEVKPLDEKFIPETIMRNEWDAEFEWTGSADRESVTMTKGSFDNVYNKIISGEMPRVKFKKTTVNEMYGGENICIMQLLHAETNDGEVHRFTLTCLDGFKLVSIDMNEFENILSVYTKELA